MNNLFLVLALLSFPVMFYFGIRMLMSYFKKNQPHMFKMLKLFGVSLGVMLVSLIAFTVTIDPADAEQAKINIAEREEAKKIAVLAQEKADAKAAEDKKAKAEKEDDKQEGEKVTTKSESSTTTKPVVKQGESLQSYIDGTLEPLVRSVSTNIDLNWEFYMMEPFGRLESGGNIEPFHSDIGLLDNLYTGIIKQIDEAKTPDHFSENEINGINEIKTELKNAINKRIEVIDILMEIPNREKILNTDTLKIIEKSNEHLQKAANTYMSLGK